MPRLLPTRPGLRSAAICALLFAGTVLLFSRTLRCGFVNYDDPSYVTANPNVQGGLSWAGVAWAFTGAADYWHPLTWLSHMLDWQLYGAAPAGHHLTSVLWHALNAVLVFLVFRRFGAGRWPAAFAAALFAWHPLRVESVAWITERKDVMSGAFFLLTLLAYARYVDRRAAGRPWGRAYLLTLAAFVAGLMSKPTLVMVPFVLLVLDFWPFARWSAPAAARRLLLEKAPFLALTAAAGVATVLMQRQAGAFVLDLPLGVRAGNALVSVARYLGKFLWPADLIVCYSHPTAWPAAAVLGATALVVGLSWVAWHERRRRPWVAAGWLWFLLLLLPVLGLVQAGFQSMADRYTYLPLLGVELAALWSLAPAIRTPTARVGAAALLAACAVCTWNQEGYWRDSVALFSHATAVAPQSGVAEDFLASALAASGRPQEADAHARRALALDPANANPWVTLAGLREQEGKLADAAADLRAALARRPDEPDVQCQLGLLELRQGQLDEARHVMLPALRSSPTRRERTLEIARATAQGGNPRAALFLFDLVLEVTPHNPGALVGAAGIHARQGDLSTAARLARQAVAAAPNDAAAYATLGTVLMLQGDRAAGLAEWRRALELDPDLPGLRDELDKAAAAR